MNKWQLNNKGVTLVELLATLAIVGMIAALAYTVLFQGYSNYQRIKIETELRDEADLIMASLLKDMFVLKGNEITLEPMCVNGKNDSLITIKKVNPNNSNEILETYQTGFKNNGVIVKNKPVQFSSSAITLKRNECGINLYNLITEEKKNKEYKIKFTLKTMKGNQEHTMEFENTVQVINSSRGD